MRDKRKADRSARRERLAARVKNAEEEKEIEAIREDAAVTKSPPADIIPKTVPFQPPLALSVLTPIQSYSSSSQPKTQVLSRINLAEFEGYSTPFEEMELKTLNDKEELAMLLQPSTSYTIPTYHQYSSISKQPTYQGSLPQYSWMANGNSASNMIAQNTSPQVDKSNKHSYLPANPATYSPLRQAKSVPDLSEMAVEVSAMSISSQACPVPSDTRLSSRTPPPRLPSTRPDLNKANSTNMSSEQALIQRLHEMGFPKDRVSRTVNRVGANEKKVIDQLLVIQKLEDFGYRLEHIENALDELQPEQDVQQNVRRHLELFNQLFDLGFPEQRISKALVAAKHDCEKAIDILLMM